MGPTSGANHNCSGKRTLGQGRADRNGTRALQNVVTALNRDSWAGDQGTTGCATMAESRLGSGSGYRGWRWRCSERPIGAKAAVTQDTGYGVRRLDSGSIRARHRQGLVQTGARVSSGSRHGCW